MKSPLKIVAPLVVLALGGVATVGLVAASPKLGTEKPQHRSPSVRTVRAELASVTLRVHTQGTVVPRTESDLVAEVSGRIIEISPSLASGGFLEPGEALVTIDPSDYRIAVERAGAALARSKSRLELARRGMQRQQRLAKKMVGSSADLDSSESNLQVAEAELRDSEAALARAELDLDRTQVRVPFAGRVREKHVDIGQYVNRGTPVARVYAVEYAEVRLPIPDRDAAFVDLPIDYRNATRDVDGQSTGPEVLLRASFAGREYTWNGRIVRTEGELDPKTRMIHAVARVEDPYGLSDEPGRPPLAVGLFVQAEILGRELRDVVRVPRAALRGKREIAVVDAESRIELRDVDVIRRDRDQVLIGKGLVAGERVVAGPLAVAVTGMHVRAFDEPALAMQGHSNEERDASAPGARGESAPGADTLARSAPAVPAPMPVDPAPGDTAQHVPERVPGSRL